MERHFQKIPKAGQPREVYPNFQFFFLEVFFPVNFAPGESTVSGISGNFSGKFLYDLPPFPNFGKFWLGGKRPVSKFDPTLSQSLARPQMAILNWICDFILRGTGPLKTTMDVIDAAKVIRLSMLRLVTIKGVSNSSTRSWPPNWAKHFFTATKVDERFEWHCKYKESTDGQN